MVTFVLVSTGEVKIIGKEEVEEVEEVAEVVKDISFLLVTVVGTAVLGVVKL